MLLSGTTKQVTPPSSSPPPKKKIKKNKIKVINSLSVSVNSKGEKQLILDLRYNNDHLYKEKIAFDDWKCFRNYL